MSKSWTTRVAISTAVVLLLALHSVGTLSGQGGGRGGPGRGGAGGFAPPRDATDQTVTGTGIISGAVVLQGAGIPVRRARVTLSAPELRGGRSTTTDDQGRFVFPALPAGRFTVSVSKTGYVGVSYGAKRAGRPGTPIQLADGQSVERVSIAMPRGGVLTGVVVDEHGEPSPGTQVRAFRYVLRTGERALEQAGQDQTDDRGMYRIYQLPPGDYIVSAVARNTPVGDMRQFVEAQISTLNQLAVQTLPDGGSFAITNGGPAGARVLQLQQQLTSLEQSQSTAYAPVYYPGTTAATSAASIPLNPGEERGGIDFQLQLVPTTRVSGIVASAAGALPPGTQVALVPGKSGASADVPGLGMSMSRVGADGRFTFNSVTPGDYQLQARAIIRQALPGNAAAPARGRGGALGPVAQMLWASTELSVSGQPFPDIVLNLQGGMTISGRVEFAGTAPGGFDVAGVRVMVQSRGSQTFEMGGIPPVTTDDSGRFVIAGVAPGRYSVTAAVAGAGRGGRGGRGPVIVQPGSATGSASLLSVTIDGRDLLDFPIDIRPNQNLANVIVTFTDRVQELSGTIQDTSGRPTSDFTIIVFPSDNRYWMPQARRIASTRPGTDGRFSFRGLPPGDYRLTAVTDVEPGEWYDPAFLSQMGAASIPISLSDGERKVQDIRLAGG